MKRAAGSSSASDVDPGGSNEQAGAEVLREFGRPPGLGLLCDSWEEVQRIRIGASNRGLIQIADELQRTETQLGRQIQRGLREHPVYGWLPKGLRGVHVARLLVLIDNPHRFPGQRCTDGHYHPANRKAGAACGLELADNSTCSALMLEPRPHSGTRSLWHFLGLHVVEGKSPRKQKGQRADWNPKGRTMVLMPGGIAEQIVRQRTPGYRDIYDATRSRLTETRAVVVSEDESGFGALGGSGAEASCENERPTGLRPIQIDNIARKVAAKAFVADLLAEWKRRVSVDGPRADALRAGRDAAAERAG